MIRYSRVALVGASLVMAAAAQAQSSVTVFGTADLFAGSVRRAGDPGHVKSVNSGGMTTSFLGFRGSEDLGGGLKAEFILASFVLYDVGAPGRFATDTFFSRDASVALAGSFGRVQLGRGFAPNFLPTINANAFGGSFVFSPLVLHQDVPLFNSSRWTFPAATAPADTGWNNEILYTTPKLGGLTANLHYQLGEVAAGGKNIGANALYNDGPVFLTAFYERAQVSNPGASVALNDTRTQWMVGGAYDAQVVKAFASYGQAKSGNTGNQAKTLSTSFSVPVGAAAFVLAGIAQTRVDTPLVAGANKRTTATLGYDHFLSKRTDLYAMVTRDQITTLTSGTTAALGIRHRF